jgi:hypothetical protein
MQGLSRVARDIVSHLLLALPLVSFSRGWLVGSFITPFPDYGVREDP